MDGSFGDSSPAKPRATSHVLGASKQASKRSLPGSIISQAPVGSVEKRCGYRAEAGLAAGADSSSEI